MLSRNTQLLMALVALIPILGYAQESKSVKIIEPKKQPQVAKPAMIDTEKFQAGVYFGSLSVEDFNANLVKGLAFTYQLNKTYLILLNYAESDVGQSTFERSAGNFLTEEQRQLSYLTLSGGYKLFTSRSFLGARHKYDSDIYLIGGIGKMEFAGESGTGWSFGASYRVVFTDWMVATFDFRNHMYDSRDVFGLSESKTRQNIEFSFGINALF